ncbi:MAG: DUF5915 domain-containing protein, partial [Anaerolineales bacterium]
YHRGDEARRRFLIPLWNVYSFLATYARLDNWQPAFAFDPDFPEGETPQSENLLDRWILSRLNQVVNLVTNALENSDSLTATIALEALLDDLTNWYVRRSRRRFWKSEHDTDKNNAYATLYHVMVKLIRLLAPIIPFVTETIYQNLVRSVRPSAYESVHHTTWPVSDELTLDTDLEDQMALARQVASLGLSARNAAGLKVRQPLQKVLVYAGETHSLLPELVEIVKDELNVKEFEFVEKASQLVTYQILPDNKLLGPRFGAQFPKVRNALANLDPAAVAFQVQNGMTVTLNVDGEEVELQPSEILVQTKPAAGLTVAFDKLATVAIDTKLTPELRAEGLARELVRRIQAMRKDAGFNIEDRITTYYQTDPEIATIFQDWGEYIQNETLTINLIEAVPPADSYQESHQIDHHTVIIGVKR